MHDIEPYYHWRHLYTAEADPRSIFYGRTYSEFEFSQTVYNYYIHPQWDEFGSKTLYLKILYTDYDAKFAIIELIGEWNDTIENDIMELKREVLDKLMAEGIIKFILIAESVFNFHSGDKDYYEELYEELSDEEIDDMSSEDITKLVLSDPTFKAAFLSKPSFWKKLVGGKPKGILVAKDILKNFN